MTDVVVHLHEVVRDRTTVERYDRVTIDERGGWLRCERGDDGDYVVDLWPRDEVRKVTGPRAALADLWGADR